LASFIIQLSRLWGGKELDMRLNLTAEKTKTIQAAKIETLKAASLAFLLGVLLIYGIRRVM